MEPWFFDRIVRDRPIPIPGDGMSITQLGHCADLSVDDEILKSAVSY